MKEFKLLDNPKESSYFADIYVDDESGEYLDEEDKPDIFPSYVKAKFLQELSNISSVKKSYIIQKDNTTEDAYKIADEYGEVGWSYRAAYHVLPDGRLFELKITKKK